MDGGCGVFGERRGVHREVTQAFQGWHPNCNRNGGDERYLMIVAAGLGVLVVFCLLLSMVQTPPAIGR